MVDLDVIPGETRDLENYCVVMISPVSQKPKPNFSLVVQISLNS